MLDVAIFRNRHQASLIYHCFKFIKYNILLCILLLINIRIFHMKEFHFNVLYLIIAKSITN